MRLLLIRHGQTPANVIGELATLIPGPGLTPLGVRQAEALPGALAESGIAALYASVMVRTQHTIAPLARDFGLPVTVLDGVHEIEAGELEGRTDAAAVHDYHGAILAWAEGRLDEPMPGGPDGRAFLARYDRGVAQVAASGHPVAVIVSHGAAIRTWSGFRARNLDRDFVMSHPLANTGVVELEGDPERGWVCVTWEGEPLGGERLDDETAVDPMGHAS